MRGSGAGCVLRAMHESWSGASGGSLASVISSGKACHARAASGTGGDWGREEEAQAVSHSSGGQAERWAGVGRGVRPTGGLGGG